MVSSGSSSTLATEALVNSGPPWQLAQRASPWKSAIPSFCCPVSAVSSPAAKRSIGALPDTRVDSYSCTARPKNSEKLYSARGYLLAARGRFGYGANTGPLGSTRTISFEFHQRGWNAALMRLEYDGPRPGRPARA